MAEMDAYSRHAPHQPLSKAPPLNEWANEWENKQE